mgnify:CR=1 FL=1
MPVDAEHGCEVEVQAVGLEDENRLALALMQILRKIGQPTLRACAAVWPCFVAAET